MSDKAHKPTAQELQAQAEHKAEVNVEARHLLQSALAGDSKSFQNELNSMPPSMQREVMAQARKLEAEREQGHQNDKFFPRVEFWNSARPGGLPSVDVTAQGKHFDKTTTIYDPEHPNATKSATDKAKEGLGRLLRH